MKEETYTRMPIQDAIPQLEDRELYHCFAGKLKMTCRWNESSGKMVRAGVSGELGVDSVLLLLKHQDETN